MTWKHPSVTKMYEALGAVADKRIEVSGNAGKCYSSTRNKFYDISFDPESNAIMSNDNTSYYKGELGYPAVAFLLQRGELEYRPEMGGLMKGIAWKDINQKFKNDFEKALEHILKDMEAIKKEGLRKYCEMLADLVKGLDLKKLRK